MHPVRPRLIVGCGYLGKRLLVLLNGQPCWVTHRPPAAELQSAQPGARTLAVDVNDPATWENLEDCAGHSGLVVYFMVPPGRVEADRFPQFIDRLNRFSPRRGILVSSTVVYGNPARVVDAASAVEPDSERARRQYRLELLWLAQLENAAVIRLAGLYGPGRIIGQSAIERGENIAGDPDGWLNLIHVDDAAALIRQSSDLDRWAQVELGCDGVPVTRREYYGFLAGLLDRPGPAFDLDNRSRGQGRRCDNGLTVTRTGWQPAHADFRQVLKDIICMPG